MGKVIHLFDNRPVNVLKCPTGTKMEIIQRLIREGRHPRGLRERTVTADFKAHAVHCGDCQLEYLELENAISL